MAGRGTMTKSDEPDADQRLEKIAKAIGAVENPEDPRVIFRLMEGVFVQVNGVPLLMPSLLPKPVNQLIGSLEMGSRERRIAEETRILLDPSVEPEGSQRAWTNRPVDIVEEGVMQSNGSPVLRALADTHHSYYVESIRSLAAGVSPPAAFARFGLTPRLISDWIDLGKQQLERGLDTYYTRFVLDINRAIGVATEQAQMVVYQNKPGKFLEAGLGQTMGDEYAAIDSVPSTLAAALRDTPSPPEETIDLVTDEEQRRLKSHGASAAQHLTGAGIDLARLNRDKQEQIGSAIVEQDPKPPSDDE